jgi:ADP-ribose pyrophosphatase YjhB (NUDIX family)
MTGAVDAGFRVLYRTAYHVLRSYWFLRRPHTRGTLMALWQGDKILLAKNSYRVPYTLPGGNVEGSERPEETIVREVAEELSVELRPEQVRHVYHGVHLFEFRHDEVDIYEAVLDRPLDLKIDGREVVWVGFVTTEEALSMNIVPHLREYLEQRRAGEAKA